METIKFLTDLSSYGDDSDFIASLPCKIEGKCELLKEIAKKLVFPEYFGFNWDALWDCLCDLSWIEKKRVILIHENLPLLSNIDMTQYLRILIDATKKHQQIKEHSLEIIFSQKDEVQVRNFVDL